MFDVPSGGFAVEAALAAPLLRAEVGTWRYPTDRKQLIHHFDRELVLSMLLSAWPNHTRGGYRPAGHTGFASVGPLMLVPPDREFCFLAPRGPIRIIQCRIKQELFGHLDAAGFLLQTIPLAAFFDIRSARVNEGLARLAEEAIAPGFASGAMAEVLASQIAIEVLRHFQTRERSAGTRRRGALPAPQMRKINDRLRAAGESPSVSELSSLCGMSSRTLLRLFKITTGKTLSQQIADVRACRASEMLSGTDVPLKEVAHSLGFSGPSSFSVAFRRATGMPPMQYRRQARGR